MNSIEVAVKNKKKRLSSLLINLSKEEPKDIAPVLENGGYKKYFSLIKYVLNLPDLRNWSDWDNWSDWSDRD